MAKLKTPGPGFVTVAELARELGVSRQAIEKAIRCGRLQAYDIDGRPLPADYTRPRRRKPVSRGSGAGRTGEVERRSGMEEAGAGRRLSGRLLIEGPRFSFRYADDITDEELWQAAHAICGILVCGKPQSWKHRRAVAVRQLLHLFRGSARRRAQEASQRYAIYLSSNWRFERDLEELPECTTTQHRLLHRLGRINSGKPLRLRRLFDIANSQD